MPFEIKFLIKFYLRHCINNTKNPTRQKIVFFVSLDILYQYTVFISIYISLRKVIRKCTFNEFSKCLSMYMPLLKIQPKYVNTYLRLKLHIKHTLVLIEIIFNYFWIIIIMDYYFYYLNFLCIIIIDILLTAYQVCFCLSHTSC